MIAPIIKYVLPFGREPARDALRIHPNLLLRDDYASAKLRKIFELGPSLSLKNVCLTITGRPLFWKKSVYIALKACSIER